MVDKLREPSIHLVRSLHLRYVQTLHLRQHAGIQLSTANHHDFLVLQLQRFQLSQVGNDHRALGHVVGIAGEHNILAPRQRAPQTFPGLAAHEDGMPHGDALEELQVLLQAPGDAIVQADTAGGIHGHHSCETETHTETAALMCGCGS